MLKYFILNLFIVLFCFQAFATNCSNYFSIKMNLDLSNHLKLSPWPEDKDIYYLKSHLSSDEYLDLKEVVLDLLPIIQTTKVIGVGRSPAPVMAFLSGLSRFSVKSIAFSDFRSKPDFHGKSPEVLRAFKYRFESLEDADLIYLFNYFDKVLSGFITDKDTVITLIDIGRTGASLYSLTSYLKKYFEFKGWNIEIQPILVSHNIFEKVVQASQAFYGVSGVVLTYNSNLIVESEISDSKWKSKAEVSYFNILNFRDHHLLFPNNPMKFNLSRNLEYDYFRVSVFVKMLQDLNLNSAEFSFSHILEHSLDGYVWDKDQRALIHPDGQKVNIKTGVY